MQNSFVFFHFWKIQLISHSQAAFVLNRLDRVHSHLSYPFALLTCALNICIHSLGNNTRGIVVTHWIYIEASKRPCQSQTSHYLMISTWCRALCTNMTNFCLVFHVPNADMFNLMALNSEYRSRWILSFFIFYFFFLLFAK